MKLIKKIFSTILLFCAVTGVMAQTTATSGSKATATLATSCTMTAEGLSFGALMLPLTSQSATSNISLLCNKNAPYTIDLAYGGIYGVGQTTTVVQNLTVYYSGGLGVVSNGVGADSYFNICGGCAPPNYTKTGTTTSSSILNGFCNPYCEIWTSTSPTTTVTKGTNYAYGKMTGVKGDNVAYNISTPDNSSKVWNTGNNSYTAQGTGLVENLPVRGKIVPGQSGRAYPTPDLYQDTVTAKVTF